MKFLVFCRSVQIYRILLFKYSNYSQYQINKGNIEIPNSYARSLIWLVFNNKKFVASVKILFYYFIRMMCKQVTPVESSQGKHFWSHSDLVRLDSGKTTYSPHTCSINNFKNKPYTVKKVQHFVCSL